MIEQLALFDQAETPVTKRKKYKSPKPVIEALIKFQSNVIAEDDEQFDKLYQYLKQQKPTAELIAYVQMSFPNNRHPAIIFRENDEYNIAWAAESLDVWKVKRKSAWSMNTQTWRWVSIDEMQQCIEWVDKHVNDDNFQWHGIYKNAMGNNWCWFKNRGIFS